MMGLNVQACCVVLPDDRTANKVRSFQTYHLDLYVPPSPTWLPMSSKDTHERVPICGIEPRSSYPSHQPASGGFDFPYPVM